MSTIQDVKAAEEKVRVILEELRSAGATYPENLRQRLATASDDYAKAVRELKS